MKKYIYLAAFLMMMGLGLSICSNDDDNQGIEKPAKMVKMTFTASFATNPATRVTWDGPKPKFTKGDKIGVYSSENTNVQELEVISVDDISGSAVISGFATPASEYHFVFPYKASTTYNTENGEISGFSDFAVVDNEYSTTALHYAKVASGNTSVAFQNLCAIEKLQCSVEEEIHENYIEASILNPVICTKGVGSPKVIEIEAICYLYDD